MIIDLNNIKYYYLTCDTNGVRKNRIIQNFSKYNIREVNPILGISKNMSGAIGFSRMIDIGLREQDRNKIFQPFVLLEDDCTKFRDFPDSIQVPDDCDILYIGLSYWGMPHSNSEAGYWNNVYYKNYNDNIVRIYNMLSLHGIIICSASGALAIQKCMMEGYFKDNIWDIYTAFIQPYYNVYALKTPLVYQDGQIGGHEEYTRITIENITNHLVDDNNINTTNVSIKMCGNPI